MTEDDSKALGQNLQFFLDQVKVSGRTAEQRQMMAVYGGVMEIVEKIFNGELVITEPTTDEKEA
jgi:hypothetical protein